MRTPVIQLVVAVPLTLGWLTACHVRLVGDYDEKLVEQARVTQSDIDKLIENERNPPRGFDTSYEGSRASYNQINADLNGLLTLAKSHQRNDATIAQVGAVQATVNEMETDHARLDHLPKTELESRQDTLTNQLASVIRTEYDLKAAN